jgi:hypothetical protein
MNKFDKKKIIPNNLQIKKKINIALVGSGKIAYEYARVIKSFNHIINTIVSSDNENKKILIKKYNIKNEYVSIEKAIKNSKNIDAWIICTSWYKLKKYFKIAIKYKLNFLIEKSIIISSQQLMTINKVIPKKDKKKIFISYNRNYYDYMPLLISLLRNNSVDQITANMSDPFDEILKKQRKTIKKNLIIFMTSHWVSLILKILRITNHKILLKNYIKFSDKNILNAKTFIFNIKKNKKNIPLILNLLPNNSSNTSINFYSKKKHILLSPIERMKVNYELKKIHTANQNIYKTKSKSFLVEKIYKPGFRFMYFDFIQSCVLKKSKSIFGTNLDDLIEIYKICEILKTK